MNRVAPAVGLLSAAMLTMPALAQQDDNHVFTGTYEQGLAHASTPLSSWLDGSHGKLRNDESNDGLLVPRGFLAYHGRVTPELDARVTLELNGDGKHELGFTEAFLEWRPVPRSAYKRRWRFGVFYPRLSFENVANGWRSPYALSSSAINTWIGEEIRSLGAEFSVSRRFDAASPHRIGASAALFFGNDSAGGLLAWRGWAIGDRQSSFGEPLPLPPLPILRPGAEFEEHASTIEPFHELDGHPGYHVSAQWEYTGKARVQLSHYDNLADPSAEGSGQYGWRTYFDALGVQLELPGQIGLIGQWMRGRTKAGHWLNGTRTVDSHFDAFFVLATRTAGRHRWSVRYDDFDLGQYDTTSHDNNIDYGHAWTLAWLYALSPQLGVGAEWTMIDSVHCGWMYYGLAPEAREELTRIRLSWRFGR